MATSLQNLSEYDPKKVPSAENMRFAMVVSEWNSEITFSLLEGAYNTLLKHGAKADQIDINYVPGSFELTCGATLQAEANLYDAVICIGCVIKGETPHFDYICQGVTGGITQLNMKYKMPFIYCVLTTNTLNQAKDRAGGKHGNKGDEAAVTAIKMVELSRIIARKK